MAENSSKHIPTLEDVVEVGSGIDPDSVDEENIRIVADSSLEGSIDDPYDDEFKKLFEHATDIDDEPPGQLSLDELTTGQSDTTADSPVETGNAPDLHITSEDNTTADEQQVAATDDNHVVSLETGVNIDTADLNTSDDSDDADIPTIHTVDTAEEPADDTGKDDLWLTDWQEDSPNTTVLGDDTTTDDTLDILHSRAEIEVTDQQTAELIEAAVDEEDHFDVTDMAAQTAETELPSTASANIDTGELVDQIVTELMPEIEWKLRTKIREVIEQHFPPADD